MNNQRYKSFVYHSKESISYDYETACLIKDGYVFEARVDKHNPDTKLFINDLKNNDISYKIINHKKRKRMIDIWIKDNKIIKQNNFYTAQELADMFEYNVMTIYRYIKAGKLRAHKTGKEFRIEKKELDRFLDKVKTKL